MLGIAQYGQTKNRIAVISLLFCNSFYQGKKGFDFYLFFGIMKTSHSPIV
jgi:hypothetical protein